MTTERSIRDNRAMVEDCCGWNKKTWADGVEYALSALPDDLRGKRVLEVGASNRSTIAPILAAKGARAVCSYYQKSKGLVENGRLKYIRDKYGIADIPTLEANIYDIHGRFDVIVMKSVLGGICRSSNYDCIRSTIKKLSKDNVADGGVILSIDNGYVTLFEKLRLYRGKGGRSWSYLDRDKLLACLSDFDVVTKGFGYLNVASASFQLGGNFEFINNIVYRVDKALISLFDPSERAVLSTIIRARA